MADETSIEDLQKRIALQEVEIGLLKDRNSLLDDQEALANSQLELAKKRLETLRQEILQHDDIANLSEKEKKSLEKRLALMQDIVKQKEAEVKAIKDSKKAAEDLDEITRRYLGTITGINDGFKDTFLGSLSQALMTTQGLQGALAKMSEGIKLAPIRAFQSILGEIEVQTIGMLKNLFEASAELTKLTGRTDVDFAAQAQSLGRQYSDLALGIDEANATLISLNTGYSNFINLSPAAQQQLKGATMEFQALGMSADTSVKLMDNLAKTMGMMPAEAQKTVRSFVAMGHQTRFTAEEIGEAFLQSYDYLASFGDKADEVFNNLIVLSDKTGVALEGMLSITKQFDTFKGAAESVGKLNTVLGGNFLDMQKIMRMGSDEQLKYLTSTIKARVGDLDSLTAQEKRYIASAMGAKSVGEAMKLLRSDTEDSENELKKFGLTNDKVKEIAEKSKTPMKVMAVALQQLAIDVAPLVKGFAEFVSTVAAFIRENAEAIKIAAGIGGGIFLIVKAIKAYRAVKKFLDIGTAATKAAMTQAEAVATAALAKAMGALATAATAAAGPMVAIGAAMAPISFALTAVVATIGLVVYFITDLLKTAIEANVPILDLGVGIALLAGSMKIAGLAAIPGALGMAAFAVAVVGLGLALMFVSGDKLANIALALSSMAKIDSATDRVADLKENINALNKLEMSDSAMKFTKTVTAISNIDDNSVKGLQAAKELAIELNATINAANAAALEKLVTAFGSFSNQMANDSGQPINITMDGDKVAAAVVKRTNRSLARKPQYGMA